MTKCERCANNGRTRRAVTRILWRENGDAEHWKPRVAVRCERCAQDLKDWLRVGPRYTGMTPRGEIVSEERLTGAATF